MTNVLAWMNKGIVAVLTAVAVLMLVGSVGINFVNIIGRYLVHAPIEWAEEAMLHLMIGFVFLGSARVAASGSHIRMDVFVRLLPDSVRMALQFVTEGLFVVVCFTLAWFCLPTVLQLYDFDQRSVAAEIPMFLPHAMVPVGLSAIAFLTLLRLVSGRWRETQHDGSH